MENNNGNAHTKRIRTVARIGAIIVYIVLAALAASVLYSVVALAYSMVVGHLSLSDLLPALLPGCISLALSGGLIYVFVLLVKLLRSLQKDDSPFVQANVKRLKRIALVLAVLGGAVALGDIVIAVTAMIAQAQMASQASSVGIIGGADGPTAIFVTSAVQPFSVSGILMLLVALAIYCIALVFDYGVSLQIQSDETL